MAKFLLPKPTQRTSFLPCYYISSKGYITRIVSPRGEFHPWVEFAPVSGQTYLSVYMFNRGKISPLPLCLYDRGETHPGGNSA